MFSDVTPETSARKSLALLPADHFPQDAEEQANLLDAIIAQSRDAILIAESDAPDLPFFRIIYANPAFIQSGLGIAARGMTLKNALSSFHESFHNSALTSHVRAALAANVPVRGETLVGEQDGQPRHVLMDIVPMPATKRGHRHWLITLRDDTEQQQIEEALRQTQDRYRLLANSMADVVSLHDAEGRFLYVTPSIFRLTGYSVEDTLGCDTLDIVHPDDRAAIRDGSSRQWLDKDSFRFEWRRLRKDGSFLWLETTTTQVYDSRGQVYRFVCCSRDITQRKKAEAVLHDEQTLLRTLIDSLPDNIYVKDRHGRFLLNNEAHRRNLNLQAEQVIGKTVWDLWPGNLAALYDTDDRQVIQTGQPLFNREEPIHDAAGNNRWISTTKTPLIGPDGLVSGLVGISRDITELREASEALRQSADKYRLLFQANPQPMWVYDVKTLAFLAVNDTAIANYGYTRQEFLHMSLADIRPREDMPRLMESLTYTQAGTQVSGPWRHLLKDGTQIWAEVHSHSLSFNGRDARLVVADDVTERKRIESESERLLSQTKHLLSEAVERADRDPLTGLINHRAFHKRFEQEAVQSLRSGCPLALAMMDLDNFKFFNDGYGHSVGDDVLRKVARALSAVCRPDSILARFGGDEFALLMPRTDAEQAVRQADLLVASLEGVGYRPPGYDAIIPLTVSIGIAVFPDDGPGRLEALAAADARLIRVKTGGTGRGELTERLRAELSCSLTDFSMLNALVTAVDTKDRYTRRHSEDVVSYSYQIAQELGMDDKMQHQVMLAALLHDVGKIGVPDRVLRKPGRLTSEEFEAIKQHPMMGAIIVGAVPGFEGTLDAIRHHHERWDGDGYPFGLKGEEIPLTARLMAVADAYSAMTTDRPYRKGMAEDVAVALLESGAGSQWDPVCVEAFVTAFVAVRRRQSRWVEE